MQLKNETKKAAIAFMAAVALCSTFPVSTYAAGIGGTAIEEQKTNEKGSWEERREKEYAKWKIKNVDGVYYYKQKMVHLLVDDAGEQTVTNNFYCNREGKINIEIIRNKKGKIKKIKKFSGKRAEEMLSNLNTGCIFKNGNGKY